MAPRGRQNTTGREARNTTRASRGGISKRKAGRVDGDGDMDMDSAGRRTKRTPTTTNPKSSATRSSARTSTRGGPSKKAQNVIEALNNGTAGSLASRVSNVGSGRTPKTRSRDMTGLTMLRVGGLKESKAATNSGGGVNDLLGFMERKAGSFRTGSKRKVAIKKHHPVGDYVYVGATEEDAEELIKLNTFVFAGAPLEVIKVDEIPERGAAVESKETKELRGRLQDILSSRYIGDNKLLRLDTLASDADLVALGTFENRDRALKTFKGLMAVCEGLFKSPKEKEDAVESISLASNNIDDVGQVEIIATTFPNLKNLDMSGNQVASMQALQPWKGKFKCLETLFMTGNPIETADPNYAATLLEWFPKLQNINGNQLRTPEQIAAQEAALWPTPIPQNGPDFRDVANVGENFLLEFFASYDSDRPGLASRLYDEESRFSISVDTRAAPDPAAALPISWSSYIKLSRNLTKITNPNARVQRLFRGTASIQDAWKTLPLTRHPNIKEELSKYIMDCHPLQGLVDPSGQSTGGVDGLIIAVHGEFDEQDPNTNVTGKRSFSRTFVLGPGKPGQMIRVVSDMLSLRTYSLLPNVFVAPAPTPADQHQAMIAELSKQTGMTAQYSDMCLAQVNWDFNNALLMFNEKKSQLPPEAFAAAGVL